VRDGLDCPLLTDQRPGLGRLGGLAAGATPLDGGFGSIAEVRTLFMSDPVLVAGWGHYLAFDLLIGTLLADRLDRAGVTRWLQAPVLLLTFMFGPAGWLLGLATEAAARWRAPAAPHAGA
jgi:hypothetical protein